MVNIDLGYLHLPDGKIIRFGANTLCKLGLEFPNKRIDEFMFMSYPEVESKIRYLKIRPDDIFIDVGACIGSWSIYAAIYGAIVHAFEVGEKQIQVLGINTRLNKIYNRIIFYNVALRSNDITDVMFDGFMKVGSIRAKWPLNSKPIPVQSVTLDQWVKQCKPPHIEYIKIDVEGMEYEVLKGAYNTIKEFRPKTIIEIHEDENEKMRENVENFMRDLGYNHEHVPGLNDYFYPKTDSKLPNQETSPTDIKLVSRPSAPSIC